MKASDASISDLIAFVKIALIIPLSNHRDHTSKGSVQNRNQQNTHQDWQLYRHE